MDGLVTGGYVFGFGICVGIHRHSLDAHALGRSGHSACNFAAVGNEDFFEHFEPVFF
jgi:hypothetical protein